VPIPLRYICLYCILLKNGYLKSTVYFRVWAHDEVRSEFTCDTRLSFSKSPILVFLLSNPRTACSLANGPIRARRERQKKSAPLPTLRGPLFFSLSLAMSFSSQTHPLVSLTQKTARTKKKKKKTKSHSTRVLTTRTENSRADAELISREITEPV